jgi:hypothetical protein
MKNGDTHNTSLTGAASMIREEDLEDMEKLQRDIKDRIAAVHEDGRAYMMAQYVRIQAHLNSEIKRIRDRFDRESLANDRKAHKLLKLKSKADDDRRDEDGR